MRQTTIAAICLILAACSSKPSLENGGSNTASGSAAGKATTNANSQLQHCAAPLGTLEIDEDETAPWYAELSQYQLPSTIPLLRLIVQQSNCFVIVDRGNALVNDLNEQSLAASGELGLNRPEQLGQMVAADYTISPSVNFTSQSGDSIGIGAVDGSVPVFGGFLGAGLGAVAASLTANSTSTTLLLVDNRSTVQIAAAQGSAKNFDFGGFGADAGGAAGISAYSSTPEGKILTAAFMDSYNQMVESLRNYKAQTINGGLVTGGTLTEATTSSSDLSKGGVTPVGAVPPYFEPWPPPRPTAFRDLNDLFDDYNKFRRVGDIQSYFETSLENSGIHEFSYFSAPGGFALVTPLEQLNADGNQEIGSIKQDQSQKSNDWFKSWITLLFLCPKGYYGAVVFFVTTDPEGPKLTENVTQDNIENWTIGGTRGLPDSVRNASASNHFVYAAVYDFEQNDKRQSVLLKNCIFNTDEQLADLGIMPKSELQH